MASNLRILDGAGDVWLDFHALYGALFQTMHGGGGDKSSDLLSLLWPNPFLEF